MPGSRLPGEFELIRRHFAPLAKSVPGALDLTDDACVLSPPLGEELVLSADALVAGIHFLATDPADLIARKMLRVNLSDLAAKGARPIGYLMTLAFDSSIDEEWVARFVAGLAADQAEFGVALLGGDTVLTPGPLTLSLTAIGAVPAGNALRRNGARSGHRIVVTGTIGDGYLGLRVLRGDFAELSLANRCHLIDRYRLPQPRVALGIALGRGRLAGAGMDISDGLLGDLAHLCDSSGCGAIVSTAMLPLSAGASELVADDPDLLRQLMTGGDDYELLLAVPPAALSEVQEMARDSGTAAVDLGAFVPETGIKVVDRDGSPMEIAATGFTHF